MATDSNDHEKFMHEALRQAYLAKDEKEVPVGVVVVCDTRIIAKGYNQIEKLNDATAHAEMLALTSAFNYFGAKYLPECSIFVTLEPCPMCAAAMNWAQIGELVYAAGDPERGFSKYQRKGQSLLHPKTTVHNGILRKESSLLLTEFFRGIRGK